MPEEDTHIYEEHIAGAGIQPYLYEPLPRPRPIPAPAVGGAHPRDNAPVEQW